MNPFETKIVIGIKEYKELLLIKTRQEVLCGYLDGTEYANERIIRAILQHPQPEKPAIEKQGGAD